MVQPDISLICKGRRSLQLFFIIVSPLLHCVKDRAHGFSQGRQGIFYSWGHFRIDGPRNDPILLHGTEAVCQDFLADSLQIFSSLNRQGRERRFLMISSFHLLPISCTVVATGHAGNSSFVSIVYHLILTVKFFRIIGLNRMLHPDYSVICRVNQYTAVLYAAFPLQHDSYFFVTTIQNCAYFTDKWSRNIMKL